MRRGLVAGITLFVLGLSPLDPATAVAAPPRRQVVAILPPVAEGDAAALALVVQARAQGLLVATGRYQELHAKSIVRAADREGLAPPALGTPNNAALLGRRLGADRVVYGTMAKKGDAWVLDAAALRGGKPDPRARSVSVKLGASLPDAVDQAAVALARLAAAPDQVTVAAPARHLTGSPEALAAYAGCYTTVIRQPVALETPVVLDEAAIKKAIDDCRAAVTADKGFDEAQAALGLALALSGQDAEAVQALAPLRGKAGYLPLYWLGRYWLVTRYQSADAGARVLRQAIERFPYFLLAYGLLAEHENAVHADAAALAAWRAYQAILPSSAFIRGRISHSLARMGKHDEALAEARAALASDPDNAEAKLELAGRQIDANQPAEAVALLEPLARTPGTRPEILLRLGYAYLRQGNSPEAVKWLDAAETNATRPEDWRTRARARLDRGMLLMKMGKTDEGQTLLASSAVGGLRNYIEAQPDDKLKQAVRDAEVAERGKKIEQYQIKLPRETSPFQVTGAGEVAPNSRPLPAPKNFEILRF